MGEVFPLTTTANGKACLAQLSEEDAVKLITNEWSRNGIQSDTDALLTQLEEVRATGLAYDLGEHSPDVSAIGIAFTDWSGTLHAISVPVPTSRFEKQRHAIEAALRETANDIERAFP